jgi:hypothetical protein
MPLVGGVVMAVMSVALFGVMFLDWYTIESVQIGRGVDVAGIPGFETKLTAWEAFDKLDVLLVLVSALGLGLALGVATLRTKVSEAATLRMLGIGGLVAGLLAAAAILIRIVDPPVNAPLEADAELGAFLGLAAAVGVAIGGALVAVKRG